MGRPSRDIADRYRWSMSGGDTQVKICGLTRLADAELAVELGAWAIGMVFYEPSPRRCSLAEAQAMAAVLRRKVELCGVFVNAPMEEIVEVSEQVGLSLLQLHGDEGPSFCAEAARRTGARTIKALQVSGMADIQDASRFHTDFHLLDARSTVPGREGLRGGTGETFDWTLLAGRRSKVPLILSGGLGSRERDRSGPTCAPLRGGYRQRNRERARTQGPRQAARVLRGCAACRVRHGRGSRRPTPVARCPTPKVSRL